MERWEEELTKVKENGANTLRHTNHISGIVQYIWQLSQRLVFLKTDELLFR